MERKALKSSRLTACWYEERAQRLEIEFNDHSRRVFKGVPAEVVRRLLSAPNPAAYYDDRIAEEYPNEPGSAGGGAQARARLDDLFGTGSG
jgi:hypothetical protein